VLGIICSALIVSAQTADDLVAKNLQAKGGIDKIKAIKSLRMSGKFQQGSFTAQVAQDAKAPDELREMFTIQGMTQIQAYDGSTGWQISPFQGRRDPEILGEDDMRDITEDADFYGPLVDYKEKGNTIEYLGVDTVDGDDAYRLKVTLKNGDIYYYYLDPDTYIEIRTERQQFIRGAVRETQTDLGSYKQVNGVYFPFAIASGPKNRPDQKGTITIEKMEANVSIPDSEFKVPSAPAAKPGGAGKPGASPLD
jgi:outer membrane lipoprotein-sorting protein